MQAFVKEQYAGALLFLLGGSALVALLLAWARGSALRITDPYHFYVSFNQAPGIDVGTPLRLKGVAIGSVSSTTADLMEARAQVQVFQRSSRIPKASEMVFNRAGPLSPSPFIDVVLPELSSSSSSLSVDLVVDVNVDGRSQSMTPSFPLILPFEGERFAAVAEAVAGPEQVEACRAEGVLICALDEIKGKQGGGMDELTALMLRQVKRGADPRVLPPHLRPS